MSVIYLSLDQLLTAHSDTIRLHGGSPGVRDLGLIESALAQPQASFSGVELYSTLHEKASALAFSLAKNHGFIDGNKRIALAANGAKIAATADEIVDTILGVASSTFDRDEFTEWVRQHARPWK